MRKRFTLLWTLVILGAALAVPASAAAAGSYPSQVVNNYCYSTGKDSVYFETKFTAKGSTPANKLTVDAWAQRWRNGAWEVVHTYARYKYGYSADGYDHWVQVWRSYVGNRFYLFRILFRLRAYQGHTVLKEKFVHSTSC